MTMGSIFKGKLGKGTVEKALRYKPSTSPWGKELVRELAGLYLDWSIMKWRYHEGFDSCVERLDSMLQPELGDSCDLSMLLNAIVLEIGMETRTTHHMSHLHHLLDPLMQVFYNRGHAEFYLDLMPVSWAPVQLAHDLKGKEGAPLSLVCKGDLANFGKGLTYCKLELFGRLGMGGSQSTHTVFRFHEPVERFVGDRSTLCDFHFYSDNPDNPALFGTENTYYFRNGLSQEQRYHLKRLGFPRGGNRLLVPAGQSQWEEAALE